MIDLVKTVFFTITVTMGGMHCQGDKDAALKSFEYTKNATIQSVSNAVSTAILKVVSVKYTNDLNAMAKVPNEIQLKLVEQISGPKLKQNEFTTSNGTLTPNPMSSNDWRCSEGQVYICRLDCYERTIISPMASLEPDYPVARAEILRYYRFGWLKPSTKDIQAESDIALDSKNSPERRHVSLKLLRSWLFSSDESHKQEPEKIFNHSLIKLLGSSNWKDPLVQFWLDDLQLDRSTPIAKLSPEKMELTKLRLGLLSNRDLPAELKYKLAHAFTRIMHGYNCDSVGDAKENVCHSDVELAVQGLAMECAAPDHLHHNLYRTFIRTFDDVHTKGRLPIVEDKLIK